MYPTGTKFKTADGTIYEIVAYDYKILEYKCSNKSSKYLELKDFSEEKLKEVEFI